MNIKTQIKAGTITYNHAETLRVRSAVKAAGWTNNHSEALTIRSTVKAGACASGSHYPEVVITAR